MRKTLLLAVLAALPAVAHSGEPHRPYTRNVAIVLYGDVEPLDWTGPYEVYNDAAGMGSLGDEPAFRVYTVGKTRAPLNGQGITITPTYSIDDAPKPDIVVFPGGPSAKVYEDPLYFAWAAQAAREAEIAQSVCTGAFVLGKAGLLDGLDVTTFFGATSSLQRTYPKARVIEGRRFVDSGRVLTTAGISAGIDGSLHVVARLLGRRVAEQVAQYMEYHWTPSSYLTKDYAYLNPSADEHGRRLQTAELDVEQKDWAGAEATYRAVLEEDPQSRDAWAGLGETLLAAGRHREAAESLVRAVTGRSDRHAGHTLLRAAGQYALADRRDEAVATLERARALGVSRDAMLQEPTLASLREDPRMRQLTASGS